MPRQFEGEMCVLCRARASSPTGEHVWPKWLLLKLFPPAKGPYTWSINGDQVLRRDGQPREHASVGSIKLPVCVVCNSVLARKFEQPAKPLIRSLMDRDGNKAFGGADAMVVARWFLKTWLLLAHSATREAEPGITPARWDTVSDDLYAWMVAAQSPPDGLSVWVTKRGGNEPGAGLTRHIPLPTVLADGREIEFRAKRAGLRSLDVSLVYHPGWEIEHPLEAEGRALRLWPREPDTGANFASLPQVHPKDTVWLEGLTVQFIPGAFGRGDLPPLSPSFDPMDLRPRISRVGWSSPRSGD